jgi:cytochrome b6-f complex iron-sulfur subunit
MSETPIEKHSRLDSIDVSNSSEPFLTEGRFKDSTEPIPRRDMLGMASMLSAGGALGLATISMMRLPKAAVEASPSKKFSVALPESLAPGEPFITPGHPVFLFRDEEGVYAISQICTHLGCIVTPEAEGFICPCHGSEFTPDGDVTKGPAPRALSWLKVAVSGDKIIVDEDSTVPHGTKVKV